VSWEQYVSDPAQTPPKELLTHIYALLADAP
jgi:effector-binding domain-containing protein